jgi:hypothetical protein
MKRGLAVAGALVALSISGVPVAQAGGEHSPGSASGVGTAKAVAFHDDMRKLWEDHIIWTRLAIVSFAGGLPDFDKNAARLLRNQEHIGNAIKPYYGRRAGNSLTTLLKEHIGGAVDLLTAAKAGDEAGLASAKRAWYANGREIARFLNRASPRFLPLASTRRLMRGHLDQTLVEATHLLSGDYGAGIRDFDLIHRHILTMADAISGAIIRQFPGRFR